MESYPHYSYIPCHEHTDTSREAAVSILPHVTRLAGELMRLFRTYPSGGFTVDELEVLLHLTHQCCSARARELVLKGLIRDSGQRRKTRSGRNAIVWTLVGEGE